MSDFNQIRNYLFQQEVILNKIQDTKEKENVVRLTLEQALEMAVRDKTVDDDENRELIVFADFYKKYLPKTFSVPPTFNENNAQIYIEQLLPDAYNGFDTLNKILKGPIAPIQSALVGLWLGGPVVKDDYIYFEEPNDVRLLRFYTKQQDYSDKLLSNLPGVETLRTSLTKLREANVTKLESVITTQKGIFFTKLKDNDGVASLFYKKNPFDEEKLLLDPNAISNEDKKYVIVSTRPSPTGKYIAIELLINGDTKQEEVRILDLSVTPPKTIDTMPKVSSNVQWLPDESGVVYVRHPEKIKNLWQDEEVYFHVLKENSSKDKLLIANKESNAPYKIESDEIPSVYIAPGSSDLIVSLDKESHQKIITTSTSNLKANGPAVWKEISNFKDEVVDFAQQGNQLYLFTTKNPKNQKSENDVNGMIVQVDLQTQNPNIGISNIIVPASSRILNPHFAAQKDALYIFEQKAATALPRAVPYSDPSNIREINIPVTGDAGDKQIRDHLDPRMNGATFFISQWNGKASIYHYSPEKPTLEEIKLEKTSDKAIEIDSTVIEEEDMNGQKFPITILYEKGKQPKLDGKNKLNVEAYGHYGFVYGPNWLKGLDLKHLGFIKKGWIIAIAHVPGGGETGEKGRKAGLQKNKTNGEKSLVKAIKALHAKGYSSPEYTAVEGVSAGGYVINWAVTNGGQALIRAFTEHSAVVTGLFLYRNGAGRANLDQFGDPHNPEEFPFVKESDPSQYFKPHTRYPDGLISYDNKDGNVHKTHMLRLAANIRASDPNNIAISMQTSCGHVYAGCEENEVIEKTAFAIAWLEAVMAKNKKVK